jgi:hypothetical protein
MREKKWGGRGFIIKLIKPLSLLPLFLPSFSQFQSEASIKNLNNDK